MCIQKKAEKEKGSAAPGASDDTVLGRLGGLGGLGGPEKRRRRGLSGGRSSLVQSPERG